MIRISLLLLPALFSVGLVHAGLLASSTRVIYPEKSHEKSLILANTNDYPVLTQIWVDDGQTGPEFKNSPFVVLPPMFKLSAKENKGIRIIYNGMKLPADRESLYWLNLYEIPAVKKDHLSQEYLNLAMNTQMKIFYRPAGLKSFTLDELKQQIQYQLLSTTNGQTLELQLKNPTPYYLNFINLKISNNLSSSSIQHAEDNILPPFSEKNYQVTNSKFQKTTQNVLEYLLIDDVGNAHKFQTELK